MLGEKVVPMGSIAYAFSEEGAGIDGKSFHCFRWKFFTAKRERQKKVTEYPCDGKTAEKRAEQVKNEISYRPWGDWFRG